MTTAPGTGGPPDLPMVTGVLPRTGRHVPERLRRLRERVWVATHMYVYLVTNAFLVGVWAMAGQGYFWPRWFLSVWGLFLAFHLWDYAVVMRRPARVRGATVHHIGR